MTSWSAPRTVPLPPGTSSLDKLYADGQGGKVDVAVLVDRNAATQIASWATRVSG